MKNLLVFIILFTLSKTNAQVGVDDAVNIGNQLSKNTTSTIDALKKRWIQTAEIEISLPTFIEESYGSSFKNNQEYEANKDNLRGDKKLTSKLSFGALYSINYPVLKKISLGALAGYQLQSQQNISALKLGGLMRYYFKDYENSNMYLSLAKNIALSKNINSSMANLRVGIAFPVNKSPNHNITMNLFWDYNFYDIHKSNFQPFETSGSYTFKGYGVSIGFQF